MRQTIIAAAAAFIIGGTLTGAVLSEAQPAPPPPMGVNGPSPAPPHPWMRWMHWMHHDQHPGWQGPPFRLIYRAPERNLSPADVQTIVQGFLLWNGNHTWKVANVAPTGDGTIGFELTTGQGSVIAKFTIDPHTARIRRLG